MSAVGPSRHIAPPQDLRRDRGIAEVDGRPSFAEGDARDRERKSMVALTDLAILSLGYLRPRRYFQ
jgi:hypothetical protein